jgi:hypothetical protein
MLKKKEMQRELEQLEEEQKVDVKKIKRSDMVAFNKVRHDVAHYFVDGCVLFRFFAHCCSIQVTGAGSLCRYG